MTITQRIVNSSFLNKVAVPSCRGFAACTVYIFDGFKIEVCHNGRMEHPLMVQGARIGTVNDEVFRDALELRTKRIASEFGQGLDTA